VGGRVGHAWRSQGVGCMSEGYYEVIRKSMGSGGVWRGRRGLDGDIRWVEVSGCVAAVGDMIASRGGG